MVQSVRGRDLRNSLSEGRGRSTYGPDAATDISFLEGPALSAPISVFSTQSHSLGAFLLPLPLLLWLQFANTTLAAFKRVLLLSLCEEAKPMWHGVKCMSCLLQSSRKETPAAQTARWKHLWRRCCDIPPLPQSC